MNRTDAIEWLKAMLEAAVQVQEARANGAGLGKALNQLWEAQCSARDALEASC